MTTAETHKLYDTTVQSYARAHARWLRYAGGEAQCAFEGAVTALLRPGMRLLDVACGPGTVARRVIGQAVGPLDVTLLDASPNMLQQCQDIPAVRMSGKMQSLPFPAGSFDLLTCAWGIETVADPRPALTEFVRVTRSGGQVVLVYCADRPAGTLIGRALRRHVARSGRGSFLRHQTMADMAAEAGARHVQSLHCTGPAAAMILHV